MSALVLAQEAAASGLTNKGVAALTYGLGAIGPGIGIGYLVGLIGFVVFFLAGA